MIVKKICKIKIDFTKLSSKTAVIQSLKLFTTKQVLITKRTLITY